MFGDKFQRLVTHIGHQFLELKCSNMMEKDRFTGKKARFDDNLL